MKTMKKNDEIVRVVDSKVDDFIKRGYSFCPKAEWKAKVRDISRKQKSESEPAVESDDKKHSKRK